MNILISWAIFLSQAPTLKHDVQLTGITFLSVVSWFANAAKTKVEIQTLCSVLAGVIAAFVFNCVETFEIVKSFESYGQFSLTGIVCTQTETPSIHSQSFGVRVVWTEHKDLRRVQENFGKAIDLKTGFRFTDCLVEAKVICETSMQINPELIMIITDTTCWCNIVQHCCTENVGCVWPPFCTMLRSFGQPCSTCWCGTCCIRLVTA